MTKKKIISVILLIITLISMLPSMVSAVEIDKAAIQYSHDCGFHLQFFDKKQNAWSYIITAYVEYSAPNGARYPAYCLNSDKKGVEAGLEYDVSISSVLNDDRIWRVITNGYPYKNLGLNADDSFVATKQAVYSIIHNRDVRSYYRGGDERGRKIVDKIEELVNIGRNGTATQKNAQISVTKVGDFTKANNNYYAQEYKVLSNIEIGKYTITDIIDFPNGSYIADTNGKARATFSSGEHFKIYIPTKEIKSNFEGTISIQSKCKTYPVFYGKSSNSNYQDYAVCYDTYGDSQGTGKFSTDIYKSTIKINKIDQQTKEKIEGVTFNAKYKDNNENIGDFKTDKNGNITISKLRPGTIILTEKSTTKHYILNTKEIEVAVEFGETKEIQIENEHKTGNLKLYKIDKDNQKIGLGNIEFDLFSEEQNKVIGTYRTNENGEIYIENLRTGDYKWIEKSTNKWYNLDTNQTEVEVEWNKTKETTMQNELKKGSIRIIKVDKNNHSIRIPNVIFEVLDKNNNLLEKIKTDENGEAKTKEYAIRDYEQLKIHEIETDKNYKLEDQIQTITLEANQIKDVTITNEKIKGNIEITKISEDANKYNGLPAGSPLEGAIFEIYNEENQKVDTVKSGKDGKAITKELDKGIYTVKEKSTGSIYYLQNENSYTVEIKEHKETVPIIIKNKSIEISVEIEKTGYIETKKNDTIKYEFSKIANTSNTYLDNFKWKDYLPTDYIRLSEIVTGTYNQDITYSITYKTNLNKEERILADNLNAKEEYKINCKDIGLQEGEYITEYTFNYGRVEAGFKEEIAPSIFCKVLDTVKNEDKFTNKTETIGEHEKLTDKAKDEWTTIVRERNTEAKKLPKTGE